MNRSLLALAIAAPIVASACGLGQQFAAGPQVGYTFGRGASIGWEASGGPIITTGSDREIDWLSGFARVSTGMSWRPSPSDTAPRERITYLAWEPWFFVGGTAGVASSSTEHALRPLLGVWEGAPYVFGGQGGGVELASHCDPCLTISAALGFRWGGAGEIYFSPKVGILNGAAKPSLFGHTQD